MKQGAGRACGNVVCCRGEADEVAHVMQELNSGSNESLCVETGTKMSCGV